MDILTKPSITRLARKAGVKSLSDNCYEDINKIIVEKLEDVLEASLLVKNEHNSKTLMPEHIYQSLSLKGHYLCKSNDTGKTTCPK